MSYSLVRSVALPRSAGAQWATPSLASTAMSSIFNTYEQIYLVLTHTAVVGEVYVSLAPYRTQYSSYSGTLAVWLSSEIGASSLDHATSLPNESITVVTYEQAVSMRYKIGLATFGIENPNDYPPVDTDLKITRPLFSTDMALLQSRALISVNGFIHRTVVGADNDLYVLKGATSARKCRLNNVGLLSFFNIGALTKLPILATNINKLSPSTDLIDGLNFSVDLPQGFSLDNKSYILVLGGYLVFVNDGTTEPVDGLNPATFWRNGASSFCLNLNNLHYKNRIFESNSYMDLSTLGITQDMGEPSLVDAQELESDEVVTNYLTMSQTFLVVVDTPMLQVKTITVRDHNTPGHFTSNVEPIYPLCVGYGRVAEYLKEQSEDGWAITVADSYTRRYVFGYKRPLDDGKISNQLVPYAPYSSLAGKLIQISGHNPN